MIFKKNKSIATLLLFFLMSFQLSGCLGDKKEENKAYDASTQVSIELILEDHMKLFTHVNYFEKKPGEYVHYRMNVRANNSTSSTILADYESQFNALCETDEDFRFNLAYSWDEYGDDEEAVVQNFTLTIAKEVSEEKLSPENSITANGSSLKVSQRKLGLLKTLNGSLSLLGVAPRSADVSVDPDCVANESTACFKFFEYNIETYKKAAPGEVQNAGCPGLSNCELNVTKQSYKQVVQVFGQPEQVIVHEMELAPEIPYFDAFLDDFLWNSPKIGPIYNGSLSHCFSSWVTVGEEGEQSYIRQCVYAKNFAYGEGDDQCPVVD